MRRAEPSPFAASLSMLQVSLATLKVRWTLSSQGWIGLAHGSMLIAKAIARSSNVREVDGAPHADLPFDVRAQDWTKVVLYHQSSRTARRSGCCNHRSRTAAHDSLSTLV